MNTARLDARLYRHLSWSLLAGVVAGTAWSALVGHSGWFDEVVHFYTSFAVMTGLGWILLARTRLFGRSVQFVLGVAGFGVVLGILWEVFEYAIGIIGTRRDTIADLVMDTLGALAAGVFFAWATGEVCSSSADAPVAKGSSFD